MKHLSQRKKYIELAGHKTSFGGDSVLSKVTRMCVDAVLLCLYNPVKNLQYTQCYLLNIQLTFDKLQKIFLYK